MIAVQRTAQVSSSRYSGVRLPANWQRRRLLTSGDPLLGVATTLSLKQRSAEARVAAPILLVRLAALSEVLIRLFALRKGGCATGAW